jgi:hypothetical protein
MATEASAAPLEASFTDCDGDVSTLRATEGGLQWWCGGRCYVRRVEGLLWTTEDGNGDAAADVLTTATGQPRATVAEPPPGPQREALKQELSRLAADCGAALTEVVGPSSAALKDAAARKALASLRAPDVRPAAGAAGGAGGAGAAGGAPRRRANGRVRAQASKRAAVEARLAQLRAPVSEDGSFQDCGAVDAALISMDDALEELGSTSHSAPERAAGSASGADGQPFAGIDWPNLPPCLSLAHEATNPNNREAKRPAKKLTAVAAAKQAKRKQKVQLRVEKKQAQCDAFARAVAAFNLPDDTLVADFGCGSCGLTLPLAWAFPRLRFVGIDIKQTALELMDARAAEAGMGNVRTHCGSITSFSEPIGLAIALHACGQASDEAMLHAVKHSAPYLVAPCCIGKVKFSFRHAHDRPMVNARENPEQRKFGDGVTLGYINRLQIQNEGGWTQLTYPRSQWLASQLGGACTPAAAPAADAEVDASAAAGGEGGGEPAVDYKQAEDIYAGIAASADMSEVHGGGGDGELELEYATRCGDSAVDALFHRTCANVVAMDRNAFAREAAGFETRLRTMPGLTSSAKSDLLIGWLPRRS